MQPKQRIGSTILAGIVAYATSYLWEQHVGAANLLKRMGAVFVPAGAAALCYLAALLWLRVPQAHDIVNLIRARLGFPKKAN